MNTANSNLSGPAPMMPEEIVFWNQAAPMMRIIQEGFRSRPFSFILASPRIDRNEPGADLFSIFAEANNWVLTTRAYHNDDREAVLAFRELCKDDPELQTEWNDYPIEMHEAGRGMFFVCNLGKTMVGQFFIDLRPIPVQTALIGSLIILPCLRSNGIGSELLRTAEEVMRQMKLTHAHIGVRSDNRASKLYERKGYQTFNEEGAFTRVPVAVERGWNFIGHPGYRFMEKAL